VIGGLVIVVLAAVAGLHLYWGLGGRWPGHDDESLKLMVIGARKRPMPGLIQCGLVTAALLAAATIVLLGQGRIERGLQSYAVYGGYVLLIAAFALRGLAAYISPAFAYARGTPFYELNRRYYAPLCLAIACLLALDYPQGLANVLAHWPHA
jgi:Protein of unknown function (DUF3995)